MTPAPHSLAYTTPREHHGDTIHATAYCDHCHETSKTDLTRWADTITYTCPQCGEDNEQEL